MERGVAVLGTWDNSRVEALIWGLQVQMGILISLCGHPADLNHPHMGERALTMHISAANFQEKMVNSVLGNLLQSKN